MEDTHDMVYAVFRDIADSVNIPIEELLKKDLDDKDIDSEKIFKTLCTGVAENLGISLDEFLNHTVDELFRMKEIPMFKKKSVFTQILRLLLEAGADPRKNDDYLMKNVACSSVATILSEFGAPLDKAPDDIRNEINSLNV